MISLQYLQVNIPFKYNYDEFNKNIEPVDTF